MGNFIKIVFFLIIIIVAGIYFSIYAPKFFKSVVSNKIFLKPAAQIPKAPAPSPVSPTPTVPTISAEPAIPDYLIPSGFTREQLSPYFKKVKISSAYASFWSAVSQIRLSFYSSKEETINISGWRLKSNKKEITIPQAINVYDPFGFALQEDIVLSNNNYVNIYSNKSPLNKNLRLNKCTGYLENIYDFNPALPKNCPSISRSEIVYLSGECQSYILSLWGCKLPETSFYNTLLGSDSGNACRAFLNTISHGSCFQKHRYDSDFLSNEWRIWMNWNILDQQHDRLWLLDKNGLLVDEYIY